MNHKICIACFLFMSFINAIKAQEIKRKAYYFSTAGNNANDGSILNPLKTFSSLNKFHINPGDSILLKAGDVFYDSIIFKADGDAQSSILLSGYGNGIATINAGNETAISIYNSSYLNLSNIKCVGSGRKNGNIKPGILISDCHNIHVLNIDVSGFQKSGLQLYNCINTIVEKISAHDNGAAGISIEGDWRNKLGAKNIIIKNCFAINNPGDPTNLENHSGNGIVAGHCTNLVIDHCLATNNGWDMPRIGNGPVGIWCYEADSVTIQYCISHHNKTSKGGEDGGGYDLDGGTTNSIIQYCLSYENQGSAFGIFQYAGASDWFNNTIRFCISENDGAVSSAHAGVYIWNGGHDSSQFKNFLFYNNTIYNTVGAAISYHSESEHSDFRFYNNLFISKKELLKGNYLKDIFLSNNWYSLQNNFNVDSNYDLKNWCSKTGKEQLNGLIKGFNLKPQFKKAGNTIYTNVEQITNFDGYKIISPLALINGAIDLEQLFKIDIGDKDFNNNPVNKKLIGACTAY